MKKLNLSNEPFYDMLIYQVIFNIAMFLVILVLNVGIYNYVGYLLGSIASLAGYILIIMHVDQVINKVSSESRAKSSAMIYFIIRMFVYGLITYVSFMIFKVHYITYTIGLLSVRLIIYFDSVVNIKGGG